MSVARSVARLSQLGVLIAFSVPAIAALAFDGGAPPVVTAATRPQLVAEAQAAHRAGDHARALVLFRRAGELQMTPLLRYNLALEQEETGALADSYLSAQQCEREATEDRKLPDRDQVLRNCQVLEGRLGPTLGHLIVELTARPVGVEVSVAGQSTGRLTPGVPYAVTPGSVSVTAKAPGRIVHSENIEVAAGQTATLRIDLVPNPDGAAELTAAQKQEIRAHYARASRDYDLGRYSDAIDEYQVIYQIDGDPVMLYNIAQAYRLTDQPDKAIHFYRRYLLRAPGARNREAVDQKILELGKLLEERARGAPARPVEE
jgi:tetratricopeptide (TPR) repeat protein